MTLWKCWQEAPSQQTRRPESSGHTTPRVPTARVVAVVAAAEDEEDEEENDEEDDEEDDEEEDPVVGGAAADKLA